MASPTILAGRGFSLTTGFLLLECQHLFWPSLLLYSQSWWSSLVSDLKALNTIYRLPTLKLIHSTQTSHLNSRLTYLTDCFTDQFGCPTDSLLSKTELLIPHHPKSVLPIAFLISVERTFILLVSTWAKIPNVLSNSFSQTTIKPLSKPLRANTGVLSSKQCQPSNLVPLPATITLWSKCSHNNLTRTAAIASWLVFHVPPYTVDSQTRNQLLF